MHARLFSSLLASWPLLVACGGEAGSAASPHVAGDLHVSGDLHISGKIVHASGEHGEGATGGHGEAATDPHDTEHVHAQGPDSAGGELAAWSHDGKDGPAHWGGLDHAYAACSEGRAQSPIDFAVADLVQMPALSFSYKAVPLRVRNNGHTLEVNASGAGGVQFATKEYYLEHLEFRAPSEHTVHGVTFPFEAHLVHKSSDGERLTVAVPFELGDSNMSIEGVWRHFPQADGPEQRFDQVIVNVDTLLPASRNYYMYIGSLTTPPCSEGVRWVVLREPVPISGRQIKQFSEVFPKSTRPTQPLNARTIGQGL